MSLLNVFRAPFAVVGWLTDVAVQSLVVQRASGAFGAERLGDSARKPVRLPAEFDTATGLAGLLRHHGVPVEFEGALQDAEESRDSWEPDELWAPPGGNAQTLVWSTEQKRSAAAFLDGDTFVGESPVVPGGSAAVDSPLPQSLPPGLDLPWKTVDLTDDWWLLKGAFPGGVLDSWGRVVGRFDTLAQAEAVVAAINPPSETPAETGQDMGGRWAAEMFPQHQKPH